MKYPVIEQEELQALLEGAYDDDSRYSHIYTNTLFDSIIGEEITGVEVVSFKYDYWEVDRDAILVLHTSDASHWFICEGDSCSETWISDIFGFSKLKGKLLQVQEIKLTKSEVYSLEDGRARQKEDKIYGYRFITELGTSVVAFRNSSNGYYGGSLEKYIPYTSNQVKYIHQTMVVDEFDIWQAD